MTALAAALLTAGFMLAAFGLAGFCLNATSAPDIADLAHTRRLATAGRWSVAAGVVLLLDSHAHIGGIALLGFTIAVCAGAFSLLTKARIRIPATA